MTDLAIAVLKENATAAEGQMLALCVDPRDILSLIAEIDRCHARLEIDRVYRMTPDGEVMEPVPYAERKTIPDGIECRDATIKGLEEMITTQKAKIAKIEAEARRYASFYPQASDGRNTFELLADIIASV